MNTKILCLSLCLLSLPLWAQEESVVRAALYLSGAASEEEITADWIERLEAARIIRVNSPRLKAGTILSDYQVACIQDYRARSGDILSYEELALVDGFSRSFVDAVRPFLSLESTSLPGAVPDSSYVHGTLLGRKTSSAWGFKGKVGGDSWRVGAARRGSTGSFYADVDISSGRILLGDFHTRWGQGLAAWTGFRMESLSSVDAFVKRATGMAPVWSYAPESVHRGVAGEYSFGGIRVAAYAGKGDFGAHADYLWRNGQIGLTLSQGKGSVDLKYNLRGTTLAGEVAVGHHRIAALGAIRGKWADVWKYAFQLRAIPAAFAGKKYGEYGLASGLSWTADRRVSLYGRTGFGSSVPALSASLTADAALLPLTGKDPRRFQLRVYGIVQWQMDGVWMLDARFTERYRNYEPPRTDVRADVKLAAGPWKGTLRLEADHCAAWGFLSYLEAGYSSLYLRLTAFSIPAWSARIYCYERDAPGTFSVPAYNGRGLNVSAYCSTSWMPFASGAYRFWRRFRIKAYLRAACQWRVSFRPQAVLNVQLQMDI